MADETKGPGTMGAQGTLRNAGADEAGGGKPAFVENYDTSVGDKYKSQEEIAREHSAEGDIINLRDKVAVVSTDKDPHHKTDSVFMVHPKVAADIVANGFATYKDKKPADTKSDGKKEEKK